MIRYIPYKSPGILKWLMHSAQWEVNTSQRDIFLTFDDGPIPEITPFVLDQLNRFRAKATFFCVGDNIRKYPEVFKTVVEAGHAIGNHTYNHLEGWKTDPARYEENIRLCDREIDQHVSHQGLRLFRPPHGRITRQQIKRLKDNYKIVMWSVLANDFNPVHSPERSLRILTKNIHPGSIVLFHDSIKTEAKLKYMLPRFMEHFVNQEYTFKILK